MASNINPYNIDGTFPIAGQDNSSQGFRNNFTNIKNNFSFAEAEISDLQSKVLVTTALTGQTINNDMGGTQIRRPQLAAWTQSLLDLGVIDGDVTLDFNQANFQKLQTVGSVSLNFVNWPASVGSGALGYGMMRVWIYVTDTAHTVTLPNAVSISVNDIAGYNQATHSITFDAPGNYVFDFSSIDGGSTYLIFDVTRNRSTFRDPSLYFNNTQAPALYVGFSTWEGLTTAQAIEPEADSLNIHEGMNAISVGNLWTANVHSPVMSFSELPGYHMYAARGNIDQGVKEAVSSNDILSYVTTRALTGNVSGNVWHPMSSIAFYATGNVATRTQGLGGNITFWTAPDATNSVTRMKQAVGIENDQSVTVFGNLVTAGAKIDAGYQYYAPTTNFTLTTYANVSRLVMDPTTTIANANIRLPAPVTDATVIEVSSTATITALSIWAGSGYTVKPNANVTLTAGTSIAFFYHSNEATWYKVR